MGCDGIWERFNNKEITDYLAKVKEDLKKNSLEVKLLKSFIDDPENELFDVNENGENIVTKDFIKKYSEFIETLFFADFIKSQELSRRLGK